jgi:hypothetical protein
MTSKRTHTLPLVRLLFIALVVLVAGRLGAQTSTLLGYEAWWYNDPSYPCNPDSMDIYIVYGYPDNQGGYVVTTRDYAGRTTYADHQGDFASSAAWLSCSPSGDCPAACNTVGVPCYILGSKPSYCYN